LTPKAATNAFARLAKKAGISTTSLHSTRHTTATNLVRPGVDVRTVSAILGHSNASVTLGIYSHVVEGAERAAVELLEDRLEGALKGG
jgi:integrase